MRVYTKNIFEDELIFDKNRRFFYNLGKSIKENEETRKEITSSGQAYLRASILIFNSMYGTMNGFELKRSDGH